MGMHEGGKIAVGCVTWFQGGAPYFRYKWSSNNSFKWPKVHGVSLGVLCLPYFFSGFPLGFPGPTWLGSWFDTKGGPVKAQFEGSEQTE